MRTDHVTRLRGFTACTTVLWTLTFFKPAAATTFTVGQGGGHGDRERCGAPEVGARRGLGRQRAGRWEGEDREESVAHGGRFAGGGGGVKLRLLALRGTIMFNSQSNLGVPAAPDG